MWQRVRRLRFDDGALLWYAVAVLVHVRIVLALLPWPRIVRLAREAPADREPRYSVDRLVRAVRRASRALPGSTCLAQALVMHRLLSRCGYTSVVRIGVRREGPQFLAHAWVECGGTCFPADDREIVRYIPLTTWPSSPRDPRR